MNVSKLFLAQIEREAADSRRSLQRVPEGRPEWKPHDIVIADMFTHLAHHRGQLTVYLRLLGVPVPAIYGPSADERVFG
jgi:uncharacterized damage-inducible protein DinB